MTIPVVVPFLEHPPSDGVPGLGNMVVVTDGSAMKEHHPQVEYHMRHCWPLSVMGWLIE